MSGMKVSITGKNDNTRDIGLNIYHDGLTLIEYDVKTNKRKAEIVLTKEDCVRMMWKINKYMMMMEFDD